MAKFTHYTANDITPNRCTITGRFKSMTDAQDSIESDDESGYFEAASIGAASDLEIGARAFHRDGVCWGIGGEAIDGPEAERAEEVANG